MLEQCKAMGIRETSQYGKCRHDSVMRRGDTGKENKSLSSIRGARNLLIYGWPVLYGKSLLSMPGPMIAPNHAVVDEKINDAIVLDWPEGLPYPVLDAGQHHRQALIKAIQKQDTKIAEKRAAGSLWQIVTLACPDP